MGRNVSMYAGMCATMRSKSVNTFVLTLALTTWTQDVSVILRVKALLVTLLIETNWQ